MGICLSYILSGTYFVAQMDKDSYLLIEVIVISVFTTLAIILFRNKPPTPPK